MNSTIRSSLTDFVKSHTSVSAAWCDKVQRKHWLRIEIVVSSWTPRVLLIDRIKSLVTWFFVHSNATDIRIFSLKHISRYCSAMNVIFRVYFHLFLSRHTVNRTGPDFLCMACFFFLGKSVKLFDFLWHSLVSCGKKSRNRNIHRMSTFVVADKLSINCDQV